MKIYSACACMLEYRDGTPYTEKDAPENAIPALIARACEWQAKRAKSYSIETRPVHFADPSSAVGTYSPILHFFNTKKEGEHIL